MADFFRGLTGGFQSGLQLGQAMRDKRQREELAQVFAKPESYQDYTPEQQRQIQGLQASGAYDVEAVPGAEGQAPTLRYVPKQGLDLQGDMPGGPIEVAPQQVQRYGGQTVAGQFDPMVLQGLRAREAARVVGAYGDPVRAAQLEADAIRMEREAKEAPLRYRGLVQQVEGGDLDLETKRRAQAANVRTDAFNTWQGQNPKATAPEMFAKARELGMPVEEQFKVASSVTGLKETTLKANKLAIEEMIQGKGLDELSQMHKDNDLLDPGSHYDVVRDKKTGQVTLQRIDSKTNKPIGGPSFTGSEAEATRYLYTAATAPETVVDYTTNLDKTKAAIAASKASLVSANAQAAAAAARIDLTKAQKTQLDELNKNRAKALEYADQFEELSEKDKAGEKGRNLIKQFKLYNSKAGGQTGIETREPPPEKRVSDAAVASYAKDIIGKPTGRRINGIEERYTAATAPAAARKALAEQGEDAQAAPDWK